jgi:hypothetical protein
MLGLQKSHHHSLPHAEKIRRDAEKIRKEAPSMTSLEARNLPNLVVDAPHATIVQRTLRTA